VEPHLIADPADERLADYIGLRRPDRVARARHIAICEGSTVVRRVLGSRLAGSLRSVLVTPRGWERLQHDLVACPAPVLVAEREVLTDVAGFDVHRGVLASLERPAEVTLDQLMAGGRTFVALEGLNDQENLGAIARTARALGADGWILDPTCADPFTRRVIRVSMGEVLFLPTVRVDDWIAALTSLRASAVEILALTPAPWATPLHDVDATGDRPVVVLCGAEGPGLTKQSLGVAARAVRIPMRDGVDSLNVGHAVAVVLAHLRRV
jgi:tRNA G18 (ribose-2'-O)-methylase SpoU